MVTPVNSASTDGIHPDDLAVDRFAAAMKAKLAAARAKGRGGWDDPAQCSVEFLAQLLAGHVSKGNAGNFEDIANLAMMLHQRGADPAVLANATVAELKALGRANDDEIDLKRACIAGMEEQADKMRARISELERQAQVGRRAVGWIKEHGRKPDWHDYERCVECGYARGHKAGCGADAILRDAEQANMGVGV